MTSDISSKSVSFYWFDPDIVVRNCLILVRKMLRVVIGD